MRKHKILFPSLAWFRGAMSLKMIPRKIKAIL